MLDEVYKKFSKNSPTEYRDLLQSNEQFLEAVMLSRASLTDAYIAKHPDVAAKHKQLSETERAKYAQQAADILSTHIAQEKSKVAFAIDPAVSDPTGVKQNQLRLDMLNDLESTLANELKPADGVAYSDMTELQKHQLGKEFGLNSFNAADKKKLDEIATKLQEQSRIKREFEADRKSNPLMNVTKDIFTPASQNARRRGEEPTLRDYAIDAANIAATFAPGGLGLISKFVNASKAAKAALAAGDILANTAVSTAIDARDLKGEDEEMNWSRASKNIPKNAALSTAGTAAGTALSRKAVPDLAKTMVGHIVPGVDTKLGKYLTNEAIEARKAVMDFSKTDKLDDVLYSNVYPKEVKDEIRKFVTRREPDMELLADHGLDESRLDQLLSNQIYANAVDIENHTVADKRRAISQILKDIAADANEVKTVNDEAMHAILKSTGHRLKQPDMQNLLEAETKVAMKRNVPLTDYQAIYSTTPLQKTVDEGLVHGKGVARSKIYGRDRQDPDAPWTVYTDPEYQKAKSQKEQYGPYRVVFLPSKFQRQADKWGNIFGLKTAEDNKSKR